MCLIVSYLSGKWPSPLSPNEDVIVSESRQMQPGEETQT